MFQDYLLPKHLPEKSTSVNNDLSLEKTSVI